LRNTVQAPGDIGRGHLSQAPLEFHALAQMEAIALALVQHVIGIG
jgi:hypothetical protein